MNHLRELINTLHILDPHTLTPLVPLVRDCRMRGATLWLCGNGGSFATAQHWACDLTKVCAVRAHVLGANAASLTAWAVADRKPDPGPSPTGRATGKATAGPSRTPPLGGFSLPGCLALLPDRGRCPDGLECYGPLTKDRGVASAESVSCTGRHTWEVFALGELSATADPRKAESDDGVRELCSEGSFRVISLRLEKGWRFEVLPPSREAFDSGDRTYRCLAGRGNDELEGPTLTRRGG